MVCFTEAFFYSFHFAGEESTDREEWEKEMKGTEHDSVEPGIIQTEPSSLCSHLFRSHIFPAGNNIMRRAEDRALIIGMLACAWAVTSAAAFALPATLSRPTLTRPTLWIIGRQPPMSPTVCALSRLALWRKRKETRLQARDDPGDFMARLLHKYVIDTDAKRGELKADVKQSYKLLPDMAMDWMLAQVTSLSLSLGSSLRYPLSLFRYMPAGALLPDVAMDWME